MAGAVTAGLGAAAPACNVAQTSTCLSQEQPPHLCVWTCIRNKAALKERGLSKCTPFRSTEDRGCIASLTVG